MRGAFDSWVERLIGAGALVGLYTLWRARDHLSGDLTLRTWWLALLVGIPVLAAVVLGVTAARSRRVVPELQGQLALTAYYSRHVYDALETLQKVLTGTIPGVTADTLIDQGILQPARDFLMQRPNEDVRLSILVTDGQDFVMPFSAGHSLESAQRFRLPIAASFSRSAYETGRIQWSGDLENDDRFTPHPRARPERAYHSIISVPVRSGDHTVGVFNVLSTLKDAFAPADFLYVWVLGAIIDVLWAGAGIPTNGDAFENGGSDN
jgi:GAF domain-containing protein